MPDLPDPTDEHGLDLMASGVAHDHYRMLATGQLGPGPVTLYLPPQLHAYQAGLARRLAPAVRVVNVPVPIPNHEDHPHWADQDLEREADMFAQEIAQEVSASGSPDRPAGTLTLPSLELPPVVRAALTQLAQQVPPGMVQTFILGPDGQPVPAGPATPLPVSSSPGGEEAPVLTSEEPARGPQRSLAKLLGWAGYALHQAAETLRELAHRVDER